MRQSGFESHSKPLGTDHLQHDFESPLAAQLRWRCPAPCVDGSIDLRIGDIDLLVEPGDEILCIARPVRVDLDRGSEVINSLSFC